MNDTFRSLQRERAQQRIELRRGALHGLAGPGQLEEDVAGTVRSGTERSTASPCSAAWTGLPLRAFAPRHRTNRASRSAGVDPNRNYDPALPHSRLPVPPIVRDPLIQSGPT